MSNEGQITLTSKMNGGINHSRQKINGALGYSSYTVINKDYEELKNKPSINGVELSGEKSLDALGIQPKGNYANIEDLPTKTSDLLNDSNYISDSEYVHTDNNFTNENKSKLESLKNYDDTEIKKDITNIEEYNTKQDANILALQEQITDLEAKNAQLESQIPTGEVEGNPIHLTDSSDLDCEIVVVGNAEQDGNPTPEAPIEIVTVGQNGSVEIDVNNGLEITDSNYQAYTATLPIQQEFVKTGDTEDTFIKQDGKWYEAHYSSKVVFDGTEELFYSATGNWTFRYKPTPAIINDSSSNYNHVKSNYFTGKATGEDKAVTSYVDLICFRYDLYKTGSTTDFKAWLSEQYANGTPLEVYYVRATPELIPCTPEQEQILNNFHTYKNVTNITASGTAKLEVKYYKDINTIYAQKDEVQTMIDSSITEAIGGAY